MTSSSIIEQEAEHFGSLAGDWWDPKGASAMLHKLNPVRLQYLRDQIDRHWQADEHSRTPLAGKSALDVGCGAGLLAEPLARMGAKVKAIDAALEVIEVAKAHALGQGLDIDYRAAAVEDLTVRYDLVTAMEVIEHVAEPQAFLDSLAARVAPGGLLIMSTPNRTAWSRLLTITLAEGFGRIPRGTHEFDRFIAPGELKAMLGKAGLTCMDVEGIAFTPLKGLHLSEDVRLNYLITAMRA